MCFLIAGNSAWEMVSTSPQHTFTSFHPLRCLHLILGLSRAPMNPQRATLDSKGVIGQQVPFSACYSTPTASVPCPPSLLLGLLLVAMASDLHKAMLSPHSKEMSPLLHLPWSWQRKEIKRDKCVTGPGSYLALLITTDRVPKGPLLSGGLGTCPCPALL